MSGGSPTTGYIVYRNDGLGGSSFATVGYDGTGSTEPSATITDLGGGRLYAFVIESLNDYGVGDVSAVFEQSTSPAAPLGLSDVHPATTTSISLSWNASVVSGEGAAAVSVYKLYRDEGTAEAELETLIETFGANVTSATVTGLESGRLYSFQVSAVSSAGEGFRSEVVASSTAPAAPLWSVPHSTHQTESTILLSWSAPPISTGVEVADYTVYRDDGLGGEVDSVVA